MRLPTLASALFEHLLTTVAWRRDPDFVVGADNPAGSYLRRWYLTPWRHAQTRLRATAAASPTRWNRLVARLAGLLPNLYLHEFLRADDDRALHDHPSWAASFILSGAYIEHTIAAGGIHHRELMERGRFRFLSTKHTHRVELLPLWWTLDDMDAAFDQAADSTTVSARCWTLFLFGPTVRDWGFHCPQRGWVHWQDFTTAGKPGEVGPGCDA